MIETLRAAQPTLRDLELHPVGRDPDEYLLYPKGDPTRPMRPGERSPLVQEVRSSGPGSRRRSSCTSCRHSAADNLWRETGNLMLAQQLLRHSSVATTQAYLHPTREDLADALARMQVVRSEKDEMA